MKVGKLIAELRKERKLTQKNIADALGIQGKTVSKWECGAGCPDLSLWQELSTILGADMSQLMEGEITANKLDTGNLKRTRFYVCPCCGNVLFSTGSASIFCCGKKLEPLASNKTEDKPEITIEKIDYENYITVDHPMTKENYLAFAALITGDKIYFNRLYPEQAPSFRCPQIPRAKLFIYSASRGLMEYTV
jgi:DNA-binding XRE family transcriptional regulator